MHDNISFKELLKLISSLQHTNFSDFTFQYFFHLRLFRRESGRFIKIESRPEIYLVNHLVLHREKCIFCAQLISFSEKLIFFKIKYYHHRWLLFEKFIFMIVFIIVSASALFYEIRSSAGDCSSRSSSI